MKRPGTREGGHPAPIQDVPDNLLPWPREWIWWRWECEGLYYAGVPMGATEAEILRVLRKKLPAYEEARYLTEEERRRIAQHLAFMHRWK